VRRTGAPTPRRAASDGTNEPTASRHPPAARGVTETCPAGCFAGACSASACVDECVLGATDKGATCKLWSLTGHAFVTPDPAGNLHDRARDYDRSLRATNMPAGAVMNADFADATLATISHYDGFHDSAIWTGSALAAEAWRLLATGSPDAAAQVAAITRTLHGNFTATGDPGYLARVVLPAAGAPDPRRGQPVCRFPSGTAASPSTARR